MYNHNYGGFDYIRIPTEFLKEFNIAFAKGNVEFIIESVTDDISWNIIGDIKIERIMKFAVELEKMKSIKATKLIIDQILSHGKEGATNGLFTIRILRTEDIKVDSLYQIIVR